MGILTFSFDKTQYKALKDGTISEVEFVSTILNKGGWHDEPDGGNRGSIISQLLSYHDSEGGAPEIDDFEVVDVSYDERTKVGKLEISYWVYRFYGCSNLDKEVDDYETWKFKIDAKNSNLIIDAPDYDTRYPNEEL